MKNKAIYTLLITLLLTGSLISYSFNKSRAGLTDGSLPAFKHISVGGSWEVYISNGPTTTLRSEGPQEEIANLFYEVKDKTLIIKNKDEKHESMGTVKIFVSTPELQQVSLGGSGLIRLEQKFSNTSSMDFSLAGSGTIEGTISSSDVDVSIAGSGDVNLSGDAKQLDLDIAGSGKFNGKNFIAESADVDVAGSGDVYVAVNSNLEADIAGSGNVYYSGNASVDKSVSGSGSVVKN